MTFEPVIVIGGPTASGKSWLAGTLARELKGDVINADSMQVYAELPVLTAQPDAALRAAVPHHLYGVMSAREICSAARWAQLAWAAIDTVREQGRRPIVVGGTGLYLRALIQGLSPVPEIPAEIREASRALLKQLGPEAFYARLAGRDPAAAARLRPSDPQRLARAWEVLEATGRSLTDWHGEDGPGRPGGSFLTFVLIPERAGLYARIDQRFVEMVQGGGIEEVRALAGMDLPAAAPALKALGVPELRAYLAGSTDLETVLAAGQQSTRRYAKRQMTWFRNQTPTANKITLDVANKTSMERILPEIFSDIRNNR
jgi:tRNA dimethylallyltransferase